MDVIETERYKKTIRLGISLARRKFGKRASVDSIHNELVNHNSQSVQSVVNVVSMLCDVIPDTEHWQRTMVKELSEFTLWCMIHHPGYRKIFVELSKSTFEDAEPCFNKDEWMFSKVDIYLANMILKYTYKTISERLYFKRQQTDITTFSNSSARYLYIQVCDAIDGASIKNAEILKTFAGILLWVATHDTAYYDMFYWAVYNLGNTKTREMTAVHYVSLDNLYIINYHKSNELTNKLRKEGKISKNDRALPNRYCVQHARYKQIQNIIKKGKGFVKV